MGSADGPTVKLGAAHGELLPSHGFSRWPHPQPWALPAGASAWRSHDGLYVISALDSMVYPTGRGHGPTWLVTVSLDASRHPARPSNTDVARVAEAFGLTDWDEDNHMPGIARALFCPVDPAHRVACECKATELVHVDPDGYRWTTPATGPCSGCDHQAMAARWGGHRPCPVHAA